MSSFQTHDYVSIAANVIMGRIVQGQLENDYAGFQQYVKANASTVAKVDHFPLFLAEMLIFLLDSFQHFLR